MSLTGQNLIAGQYRAGSGGTYHATNPATGEQLDPPFGTASADDVDAACEAAWAAFEATMNQPAETRALFLEAIADELLAIKEDLVPRVIQESALPQGRVEGELGRTTGQLRLFAAEVRAGHWRGLRIDPALPERQPLPRPDLRLRRIPIGPVAVFGASNFPLAFSVAGGDTASAIAAGCPVVAKAHPAHPGTSELVGAAITRAAARTGLPGGVFSLLHGGPDLGGQIVRHPRIKAVGFTGSRQAGMSIFAMAAARPEPIPVVAEMSSINPVILFPGALEARGKAIAEGLAGSIALGAGQFCTNPGLVFAIAPPAETLAGFRQALAEAITATAPQAMLTEGIANAYASGLDTYGATGGVTALAKGGAAERRAPACVFETDARTFLSNPSLQAENFGASSILITCASAEEAIAALKAMEGQLTATLQMEDCDTALASDFVPVLERMAGRILVNGFPTGVEVSHAMVHGGPFPATSDSRTTSVGTLAIDRFLRPVCYQNFPPGLLPDELADANPTGARRRIDGAY
ncbi:MAG: aldehyde dehydrogenase (NADP(+)) [Hyphomonas sp.]|nr:aldehyde dehydrogenase (NADP(+)) [Hyphomonas sp.]